MRRKPQNPQVCADSAAFADRVVSHVTRLQALHTTSKPQKIKHKIGYAVGGYRIIDRLSFLIDIAVKHS